ncbi:Class II abasic (AP) endonuclease [Orbilia oligospora]|uniref:DNA-(apurinic or apyrimidinic site) endonuclease n=1 Tax=Orbilia oligospora TaxID=2813651 RepID=A0A7C8P8T6_ORBOL|nr:Class II abasic (AP) endonuclease [Orbilia oligospora]KAF3298459.1 Class II abasic (AP) endonuclease [Orbilia oligospora]TGJ68181.1 Class II abasic (AP) endonuclease [Orbilia oligospora]
MSMESGTIKRIICGLIFRLKINRLFYRNPFGYMPWSETKNFGTMFDILEADVVCFQELKIQSKDLRDDMVLIPGWDSYFTFPKHKKGYSGVAIYTRQSKISPIKAEEGITGHLLPTGAARNTSYRDLPEDQQIGGYPTIDKEDGVVLDSEGRGLVVDFGLFVLIGTYCPVGREDSARQDFRMAWLKALDERIRNLTKMGKRVITVGDLNIAPEPIDSADAWEMQKRLGPDSSEMLEWNETPAKKLLRNLCEPSEEAVMVDVVRQFFPDRVAMYTHWETKINARPGNYGSRIDYVVASSSMKDWFESADIQNGLHGSDHCPVYAVLKPEIELEGEKRVLLDLVNPTGVFVGGERKQELPPPPKMSARLIPHFRGRRSIKDMFQRKTVAKVVSIAGSSTQEPVEPSGENGKARVLAPAEDADLPSTQVEPGSRLAKRPLDNEPNDDPLDLPEPSQSTPKKARTTAVAWTVKLSKPRQTGRSSQSPMKPSSQYTSTLIASESSIPADCLENSSQLSVISNDDETTSEAPKPDTTPKKIVDLAESRASWNKLFTKPSAPLCDGHSEPAKKMQTRKPGLNNGRWFWMCARPVGPSGPKERSGRSNDEWRCDYFKWYR